MTSPRPRASLRASLSAALLAASTVLAVAVPARAVSLTDPDDLAGPLDVWEYALRLDADVDLLEISFTTYEATTNRDLNVRAGNVVKLQFDIDEDGGADFVGRVQIAQGSVVMLLTGFDIDMGSRYVERTGTRSFTTFVPTELLRLPWAPGWIPDRYRVRLVVTTDAGTDRTRWLVARNDST